MVSFFFIGDWLKSKISGVHLALMLDPFLLAKIYNILLPMLLLVCFVFYKFYYNEIRINNQCDARKNISPNVKCEIKSFYKILFCFPEKPK